VREGEEKKGEGKGQGMGIGGGELRHGLWGMDAPGRRYALPARGGFLSKEIKGIVDAFLRRMFSFGYCSQLHFVRQLFAKGDETLFHTCMIFLCSTVNF